MPILQVGFKKLSKHAIIPTKAHPTDSGFDLYAAEDVIIAPGETKVVKTDIAVVLPSGYEAQVRPRSGITSKTKLRVQLGTIDNAYRGNIGIIVDNIAPLKDSETGDFIGIDTIPIAFIEVNACYDQTYIINKGDKIAQLVIQAIPSTIGVEIFDLDNTDRGENGFGSTGV